MNILLTGGGGFQGSHLAEALLLKGHNISVLNTYSENAKQNLNGVIDRINLVWGSITDKEVVEKSARNQDVIFHLAARINVDESLQDPLSYINANVVGTYNVLESVRRSESRLILVTSCEVYGDGHDLIENEKLSEKSELKPNSPYAASKAAADRLSYSYYKSYDINVTIIRPFNIFGERQKSGLFGALIPILVGRAMRGEALTIFGDGTAERDYSYISDIIRFYSLVLDRNDLKGKTINVASEVNIAIKDIAKYIAQKFNVPTIVAPARPGEVSRFPADISFAKSLGYAPEVSIWEGIDRYIDWAKKQACYKLKNH